MCYAPASRMDALRSQGLKSVVYGTLVVAMGIVFVVQFKPGGQGGQGMKAECVAEVRGECISSRDFRSTMALVAPRADEATLKKLQLQRRIIDGLVERTLLLQDAERLGVTLSDDDLNTELTAGRALVSLGVETPPLVQYNLRLSAERPMRVLDVKTNGQFDKKAYTKALRLYVGRGEAEFREMQRQENLAARMRDLVKSRVRLSEGEVREAFDREKTKLSFHYVRLERTWISRYILPKTKAAIDAFAAEHKAQIDAAWESRKKQYLPECRRARHILVKVDSTATDDEKSAARKKIEAAIERAKKGEPFADLAREISEDVSASEGGDLGCVAKGKMVKPFEEAVFSLKENELSTVVETEYGFHAIRLDGIFKDADAEAQGRQDIARELMLNILSETKAAEIGKKILEAIQAGKPFDQTVASVVASYLPESPTENEKGKKEPSKDDKKGDKKDDRDKKDAPRPKDPLDDPEAPKAAVATDLTADGASPLSGAEALNVAYSLTKVGEVPRDLVKLDNGYAVLQLIERKAPSQQDFDAERERFSRALLAVKQHEALIAYVNRLREVSKDKIKVNQGYLTEKSTAPEEPTE